MATHTDAQARLNALYHLYFNISESLMDIEESPVDFIEERYPELADWFIPRWYEMHTNRHDWLDTVTDIIADEL